MNRRFSAMVLVIGLALASVPGQAAAQRVSESQNAMVVSSTVEASEAGLRILREGGNAIDAAAATAFALMVTDPAMCSLAGRSQILIRLANGDVVGIDGATQSPGGVGEPARIKQGYGTVPVPGSPAALEEMVTKYGTFPLGRILQPAIELARDGFVVNEEYHQSFRKYGEDFGDYPGTAKHFLRSDGSFYSQGDTLKQPALASTLERMASAGSQVLYEGSAGRQILADMEEHGGFITLPDLAQYTPLAGEIVSGHYRGHEIIARGGQCDGGSVIEMLQILGTFELEDDFQDRSRYFELLAHLTHIGHQDEHVPDEEQVSQAMAARRAQDIIEGRIVPSAVQQAEEEDPGETNHLSVVDALGNVVSLTQSIGPSFGAKAAHPELGFFYAYSYDMNDDPVPHQREKTSQSPTILLREGKPVLAIGSAGSRRIPGSVVQSIVNYIDHAMSPAQAVAFPRVFYFGDDLRLETPGLDPSVPSDLKNKGFTVKEYVSLDGWFGRVQAIFIDPETGRITGVSDPRDFGAARGN
ncbi:MAG: gamma-glutamyltransferase [Xanthomonadales bacterium]|nr:gamma-glutamyltransferase [Xanthomonadales bacterium]